MRIEVVRRLVDEEDARLCQQRACDGEALLHAVRVLADRDAGDVVEPHRRQDVERPLLRGAPAEAVQPREETQVLQARDAEIEAAVARGNKADGRALRARVPRRVRPEHSNGAAVGLDQAAEHAQERRLAGAVRPQERVDLTGLDRERDARERSPPGEAARDLAHVDGGRRPVGVFENLD